MDGSDTLEEFSEWEEAAEDAMEEARLQGCRSELALQQQRSDGEGSTKVRQGPAKVRRRSGEGPAKIRRRSVEDPAKVRRRSGKSPAMVRRWSGGDRGRGNDNEKKRYLKLWIPC